jgi:cyclic pyranopterin phosphate synthase
MPEDLAFIPHDQILRYEEILRLMRIFAKRGVRKVKVTGGEPLVRRGCADLIRELKEIDGIDNVTITTNGVLLADQLPELLAAGVDGINISLDTLHRDRFARITNRDEFDRVWSGMEAAVASGVKVKLNCVPVQGNNDDELIDFFELAKNNHMDVRFIEMMPIGNGKKFEPISIEDIIALFRETYDGIYEVQEKRGNGPAVYYKNDDFKGCVGFIGAVHRQFCDSCNRIRLTSEGYLKLCLYYSQGMDLRSMLRDDASDEAIFAAIDEAISHKPKEHPFACHTVQSENSVCDGQTGTLQAEVDEQDLRNMSQIGG